jgi:hypothetical protein
LPTGDGRGLLCAEFNDFGDALALVLLGHLPATQRFLLTNNLLMVLLDAAEFRLYLRVFLSLARFEFLQLFLLSGVVGRACCRRVASLSISSGEVPAASRARSTEARLMSR